MPKKTKREKLLSEYRKKIVSPSEKLNHIKPTEISKEDLSINRYFSEDLKKSFFLISLIIFIEVLIYYANIKNIIHF